MAGEWKKGTATFYNSYPPCCQGEPNYDPKASTNECNEYSGCKYKGAFAGVKGKLSFDEVKNRNIVAFYDDHNQAGKNGGEWWNKNVRGRKIEIRHPTTGKTMVVEALDTCGNGDCGGCCSKNSKKGGGYLLDLEWYTSERFFGKPQNGPLEWRWA